MKRVRSLPDLTKLIYKFKLWEYRNIYKSDSDLVQISCRGQIEEINKKILTRQIKTQLAPSGAVLNEFKVNGDFTEDACPICNLDKFKIAVVTNCGHFICDECFTDYIKHKEDHDSHSPLTCPMCRENISSIVYYVVEKPQLLDEEFKLLEQFPKIIGTTISGDKTFQVQYGISHINDELNPCVVEVNIDRKDETVIPNIHFIIDVSGSMGEILPFLKDNLINYIRSHLLGGKISIDLFNSNYTNLLEPITVSDNIDFIVSKITAIRSGGGTKLENCLKETRENLLPKWGTLNPTVVILTDGATDDVDESHTHFQAIKSNYNILLLGVGHSYSYANCIKIVESNAAVFEHIANIDKFVPVLSDRVHGDVTKVRIITEGNNWIFTGAKKTHEDVQYIQSGIKLRFSTTNGCPRIFVNEAEITVNYNEKLNLESQTALFEFLSVSLINKIGTEVFCTNGLRMKIKLQQLKKFIKSKMLPFDVQERLTKFIKDISNICDVQMKNSVHYEYGYECLRGKSSISVGRAVSSALRGCSSGGQC